MQFARYDLKLTFIEPLLGTIAKDPNVYRRFIDTLRPEDVEEPPAPDVVADDREVSGWTTFYRIGGNGGAPCLMDYQIKGYLKEVGNITKENLNLKALRSKIDADLFVFPRQIPIGGTLAEEPLERPLRAMTAQGPRVSVVRSDQIQPGAIITCEIAIRDKSAVTEKVLRELLSYGEMLGLGQWRNAGYGRFVAELTRKA